MPEHLKYETQIYDSIHGYIGLTSSELSIVNSLIFQRLHQIRHLGTAYFVYPGATQSRFSHSLGAMFVIGRIAEKLRQLGYLKDIDEIQKLRLAALLHDVGHYPFSHVIENSILRLGDGEVGRHEDFSNHLIRKSPIRDKFESYDAEEIASILSKKYVKNPLYSLLISSDLDADRIDYLMRDAYHTGVAYGIIDVDRLIRTVKVDEEEHLAVEDKGKQALENFLMARYHMYQTVYYHKTVVGFELMLQRIYEKMADNKLVYGPSEILSLEDEEEIYNFNDNYVWHAMRTYEKKGETDGNLKELISYFKRRKRLKRIYEAEGISISGNATPQYSRISLIELPQHFDTLCKAAGVPKEWTFYSHPKPLEILAPAN